MIRSILRVYDNDIISLSLFIIFTFTMIALYKGGYKQFGFFVCMCAIFSLIAFLHLINVNIYIQVITCLISTILNLLYYNKK